MGAQSDSWLISMHRPAKYDPELTNLGRILTEFGPSQPDLHRFGPMPAKFDTLWFAFDKHGGSCPKLVDSGPHLVELRQTWSNSSHICLNPGRTCPESAKRSGNMANLGRTRSNFG